MGFLLRRVTPHVFYPDYGVFPLVITDVVAPRCEEPKLVIRVINYELVQPIRPRYINVTDGQTDGRTT